MKSREIPDPVPPELPLCRHLIYLIICLKYDVHNYSYNTSALHICAVCTKCTRELTGKTRIFTFIVRFQCNTCKYSGHHTFHRHHPCSSKRGAWWMDKGVVLHFNHTSKSRGSWLVLCGRRELSKTRSKRVLVHELREIYTKYTLHTLRVRVFIGCRAVSIDTRQHKIDSMSPSKTIYGTTWNTALNNYYTSVCCLHFLGPTFFMTANWQFAVYTIRNQPLADLIVVVYFR